MIPIRSRRAPVAALSPDAAAAPRRIGDGSPRRFVQWSAEKDALLAEMWAEGVPAGGIAAAIGSDASRNAVIGRAHRIGLPRRRSPIPGARAGR